MRLSITDARLRMGAAALAGDDGRTLAAKRDERRGIMSALCTTAGESPSTTGAAASSSSVAARLRVQLACPTRPTRPQRRLRDLHSAAMTPNSPTKRARQALYSAVAVFPGRGARRWSRDSQLTHVLEAGQVFAIRVRKTACSCSCAARRWPPLGRAAS